MSGIENHASAFYWVTGATSVIMSRYVPDFVVFFISIDQSMYKP